ncbi:hypothetical protein DSCO28_19100 [Desulfosarcina ovata subsp. sediminis]|uniref:DUF86 domain-containing protein n=1 Tax=Desulfosarcina ovata subsp. sediminis TaxID=885957 RepID=A0A5K7ZIW9_9BACT|nr:DUF86 domain-containing protein [Desulfosarcina ovata]BBO81344.1 hypothetical protein DSCO28_19100 [Desulfosarcina ovata subsp. sediminis]
MVDKDLILAKVGSIQRHLNRINQKSNVDVGTFKSDMDRQESVMFNLQMAIQNCIDIAAHIVSEEGFGVPGSANEMFYMLEENGLIAHEVTEKMVKAVGLRNLMVHEYGRINLDQIHQVARKDIKDIEAFMRKIMIKIS